MVATIIQPEPAFIKRIKYLRELFLAPASVETFRLE